MSLVDSTPARYYSQHDEGVNAVSQKGPSKELGMASHFHACPQAELFTPKRERSAGLL